LGELSHPHTPAGFVYLKFVWEPSLPLFFGGESYKPATFEGFVNLNFMRGTALPLFSGGESCTFTIAVYVFKVHMGDCPSLLWCAQGTPPSLLCVLFSSMFIIKFYFSPEQGSDCLGGYADLSQEWLWVYRMLLIC
jgi:hypothetical protein